MTFNQARKLGGNVSKGEKTSLSLFYSTLEVEEAGRADTKMIPYAKQNKVFNVDQIDGLPDGFMDKFVASPRLNDLKPCVKAEAFIKNVPTIIKEVDGVPCFKPSLDLMSMPRLGQFKNCRTLLCDGLAHWTAHSERLNRPILTEFSKTNYFKEELFAELTAAFLCPSVGIEPLIDDEHAPYLDGYIKLLKNEPGAFVTVCSQAEKAADYLRSLQLDANNV